VEKVCPVWYDPSRPLCRAPSLSRADSAACAWAIRVIMCVCVIVCVDFSTQVPEPVSVTNPMGDKLTDTATVQTIKFALRRQVQSSNTWFKHAVRRTWNAHSIHKINQSKRVVYSERMEQRLSECFPDPEAEPLNFEDFQSLYRALLSNCADLVGWSPLHWACNRVCWYVWQCVAVCVAVCCGVRVYTPRRDIYLVGWSPLH